MWCRSFGARALEEELKPAALAPVPAHMATPLERQFAEVLGIEDEVMFPRLPLEVGSCESVSRCCWRWLTRAALEEISGEPLGHRDIADAVAELRREVSTVGELRAWAEEARIELEQAVVTKQELDELRKTHAETAEEMQALRFKEVEMNRMSQEIRAQQGFFDRMKKSENELREEVARLRAEQVVLVEGDLVAARHRAAQAEKDVQALSKSKEELKVSSDELDVQLALLRREVTNEKEKNVQLKQQYEDAQKHGKQRQRKGSRGRAGVPKFGR